MLAFDFVCAGSAMSAFCWGGGGWKWWSYEVDIHFSMFLNIENDEDAFSDLSFKTRNLSVSLKIAQAANRKFLNILLVLV